MLISRQEQKLFAEILKGILSTNRSFMNAPFIKGIIPTNFSSIRSMYIEGENSIMSNLPRPSITQMKHHGYVSPIEVIKLMFALDIPFEHIYLKEYKAENHSQDSFYRTVAVEQSIKDAKELYQDDEDIMVLFGIEFNDDFDPLNNKSNKGSVFFKSLTISPKNNEVESLQNTFAIGIGQKGDHDELENLYTSDLNKLKNPEEVNTFFHLGLRKLVRVHLIVCALNLDQIAGRPFTCFIGGNSRFGALYGHSINFRNISNFLPSCTNCFNQLFNEEISSICSKCANWNPYSPNVTYENIEVRTVENPKPMKLTVELQKKESLLCLKKLEENEWNEKDVKERLQYYCFPESHVKEILTIHKRRQLCDGDSSKMSLEVRNIVNECKIKKKSIFESPICYVWRRNIGFCNFSTAPMHLLFLGIMKVIIKIQAKVASLRKLTAEYVQHTEKKMSMIIETKANWLCTVNFYNGATTGWVSENYIAYAKLMKWFMSDFNYEDSDWLTDDIEKPIAELTKQECIQWLQKRDSTYKECSMSQMKRQINSKISMQERVSKEFSNYHKMIMPVIVSYQYLVSLIMTSNKENVEKITTGINIFLTLMHNLDKKMWKEKNEGEFVPIWITKFNFINLFNVPEQIAVFGKVKNLWEGGALGEK